MRRQTITFNFYNKTAGGILLIFTLLLCFVPTCWAGGSLQLTTYYPAPQGAYDRIKLMPQTTTPLSCQIGAMMVEQSSGKLLYCRDVGGVGTWGYFSNIWTGAGTNIYPTLTDTKPLIAAAIGTSTPIFKLTLDNDGGILAVGAFGSGVITSYPASAQSKTNPAQARLIWYPRKAAFRALWDRWGVTDDSQIGNYSVAFGDTTKASGAASVVSGLWNTVSGNYGTIAGGANNTVSGHWSTITGGENNIAAGQYSVVSGFNNNASGNYNTISGGLNHLSNGDGQTIGGGESNSISLDAPYSTISGGKSNSIVHNITAATGDDAFDTSNYSVIGGGDGNTITRGGYSTIGGGSGNTLKGAYAYIGGGALNNNYAEVLVVPAVPRGNFSVIGGGRANSAKGHWSVVTGGLANKADADYSTVLGGRNNNATGTSSVIAGGSNNSIAGTFSVIAGGDNNSVGLANYSWAGGRNMNLTYNAQRTFLWGYSDTAIAVDSADSFILAAGTSGSAAVNPKLSINELSPAGILSITLPSGSTSDLLAITSTNIATPGNILIVKNNGYVGVGQPNPSKPLEFGAQANGAYLTVGGVWTSTSSRSFKDNIQPLNTEKALEAFQQLQPVTYNYKNDKTEHHVGFIAEDVPDLVAAEGRRSLSPMPVTAVLTAVLKKQKQDIAEGQNEINMIKEEIKNIDAQLKINTKQ